MPPPTSNVKPRPYKSILTAALHRRFVSIVWRMAAFCFLESLLMGNHGSYSWLVFSAAVRAVLLFVPVIVLILIRLKQIQFQARATSSGLETAFYVATSADTYVTAAGYLLSAWFFSEIYIMSASPEAGLSWVTEGQIYEKLRLNENVIYLRCHAFIIALIQFCIHLYRDDSIVRLPAPQSTVKVQEKGQKPSVHEAVKGPNESLKDTLPWVAVSCLCRSAICLITGPFLYLFIRPFAWHLSLAFARNVMRWNIPEYSEYDTIPPFHYSILWRTLVQGVFLFTLWDGCQTVFSIFVAQEPIKNDHPLTDDYKKPAKDKDPTKPADSKPTVAKDPNGSLMNGLKAKNKKANCFALWELDIIVRRFAERRKSLLTELDRKDGSAWTQTLGVCLALVDGISERIDPKPLPVIDASKEVQHLPRITPGVNQDQNIQTPYKPNGALEAVANEARKFGRSVGSSPQPFILYPKLKDTVGAARKRLLTQEQQKELSREQITSGFRQWTVWLLRQWIWLPKSPVTEEFQPLAFLHRTYFRQIRSKVFGSPHSDYFMVTRAVDAISGLVAASVTEDTYGVVSKSIPQIWRSFVKAVNAIEGLEERTAPHWTDVNFNTETKKDEHVEQLLLHLKSGINTLLLNFGSVATEVGLTAADVQAARKTIASLDEGSKQKK